MSKSAGPSRRSISRNSKTCETAEVRPHDVLSKNHSRSQGRRRMGIRELNLTKEQHEWLNGWLELWGAWVYSGRLEKRMSSVIAKFMESVEPGRVMTRPMCNDDDGMLISQVVDSVMY
ncbi:bacteriophage ST64T antitermination protein gp23, partial [Escherichia coli TA054]